MRTYIWVLEVEAGVMKKINKIKALLRQDILKLRNINQRRTEGAINKGLNEGRRDNGLAGGAGKRRRCLETKTDETQVSTLMESDERKTGKESQMLSK